MRKWTLHSHKLYCSTVECLSHNSSTNKSSFRGLKIRGTTVQNTPIVHYQECPFLHGILNFKLFAVQHSCELEIGTIPLVKNGKRNCRRCPEYLIVLYPQHVSFRIQLYNRLLCFNKETLSSLLHRV